MGRLLSGMFRHRCNGLLGAAAGSHASTGTTGDHIAGIFVPCWLKVEFQAPARHAWPRKPKQRKQQDPHRHTALARESVIISRLWRIGHPLTADAAVSQIEGPQESHCVQRVCLKA